MNYRFDDMTAAEVVLIGIALDLMPHGKVAGLVKKIQAQITTQDAIARREGSAFGEVPASEVD